MKHTHRPLADLLNQFVEIVPSGNQESLRALANAFVRHEVIVPDGAHLGGNADLKKTLQNELSRTGDAIAEDNTRRGVGAAMNELAGVLEKKARQTSWLFGAVVTLPLLAMLPVVGLTVVQGAPTNAPYLLAFFFATAEAALFYAFQDARKHIVCLETDLFRFKLLEVRLEMVQRTPNEDLKTVLHQFISENLLADQNTAARMTVHNWGSVGKMVTVGTVHGSVTSG